MSTKGSQRSKAETKVSNGGDGKARQPANAWSKRLQSKLSTGPPPGMGPINNKSVVASSQKSSSVSLESFQHRERLLHLSLTLVGRKVELHQTNGAIVQGIFHTFTPFSSLPADQRNRYVLKEIQIHKQPLNETEMKDGITLVIPASKVVLLHAADISVSLREVENGLTNLGERPVSKIGFATDTQISSSMASGRTNDLVAAGNAWTSGGNNSGSNSYRNQAGGANGSSLQATNSRAQALGGRNIKGGNAPNNQQGLASDATTGKISGSIGQWDQFKANKELFNVNATFDENLYTTQLDKSQMDAKKFAEAERIANEIENTMTRNIHMAEERGFKVETDFDEEDLYSGVLTKDGKNRHEKVSITKSKNSAAASELKTSSKTAVPRKTMNYAAAAAKADASKIKTAPPGFTSSKNPDPMLTSKNNDEKKETSAESSTAFVTPEKKTKGNVEPTEKKPRSIEETTETTESKNENGVSKESSTTNDNDIKVETKNKPTEKKEDKKEVKKSSKLNANAKSFTFNPSAKTFTPTFGATVSTNPTPPQPLDPNVQMYGGVHAMQPPHYMQPGPMGQPGMMPMMNPQYTNMRYPASYGMEQQMSQMQHPVPHLQAQSTPSLSSAQKSGNAPTPTPGSDASNAYGNDDDKARQREDDASNTPAQVGGQQPQRTQQQQTEQPVHSQGPTQQQQIPMQYSVPPNAYFSPGIAMPPRGPAYPPYVANPQQIAGRPNVPPYGIYPMQPGGMPQNIQMRGPASNPYYSGPNGPIAYPPSAHMGYPMMEDGGRGRGGRSSNSGRGGRGRGGRQGRGGRGRSNYHNSGANSGKNSQQQYSNQQSQQQPPDVKTSTNCNKFDRCGKLLNHIVE